MQQPHTVIIYNLLIFEEIPFHFLTICLKSSSCMFEMQCKVACLKCNVKVAKFEMQC